jgi:hypothetical protein
MIEACEGFGRDQLVWRQGQFTENVLDNPLAPTFELLHGSPADHELVGQILETLEEVIEFGRKSDPIPQEGVAEVVL